MWFEFLERITGQDLELINFLQRMAGYMLTGSTREHALFFFHGTGANGKTTFISVLEAVLGDREDLPPQRHGYRAEHR